YATRRPFLSFLGTNRTEQTARALIDYCEAEGLPTALRLMPEISVANMHAPDLHVLEDRDNFDYIYSVGELSEMRGTRFHRKRTMTNQFTRGNPAARIEVACLDDRGVQERISAVIDRWERHKIDQKKEYALDHEHAAIERLLRISAAHEL